VRSLRDESFFSNGHESPTGVASPWASELVSVARFQKSFGSFSSSEGLKPIDVRLRHRAHCSYQHGSLCHHEAAKAPSLRKTRMPPVPRNLRCPVIALFRRVRPLSSLLFQVPGPRSTACPGHTPSWRQQLLPSFHPKCIDKRFRLGSR
jgi:hypothetical protein